MNSIRYTCGLCSRPGFAEYDPEFIKNLAPFMAVLHCNPCADFLERVRKLTSVARHLVVQHWNVSRTKAPSADRLAQLRADLEDITKKIVGVTCGHWKVTNEWSVEFVNELLRQPGNTEAIVRVYCKGVRKSAPRTLFQTAPDA